jgi:PGM1 C-terminal domain
MSAPFPVPGPRPSSLEEIEAFERLKPRLAELWSDVFPPDDKPYTSVVVPSLSLDSGELAKLRGASFYEERLLFLMIRLRNPRARLVYVTSQPVHEMVVDYYLQLLVGVPASHARRRLTLLSAYDASPTPLTEKILRRPRLLERVRAAIPDRSQAYLTVFNSTELERRLAVALGIPLNAVDPALRDLGTKSGARRVFRDAGIEQPTGIEGLRTESEILDALDELRRGRPGLRRAVLKLDESFSGEGNALVDLPEAQDPETLARALRGLRFSVPQETCDSYLEKFGRMGGIAEEWVEGGDVRSPSVQLRINPRSQVFVTSTHEQILCGPTGQTYSGCRFPARDEYRMQLSEAGRRVGAVLAGEGVVSRFSVDFLALRPSPESAWQIRALEINLRMGGTTHPMFALRFLTGGRLDADSGLFRSASGVPKFYRATDDLYSPAYRGLLPEDLVEILTVNRLLYDPTSETGVLFHMIGAVSEHGKFGVIAIGDSPKQAENVFLRTVEVLDAETRSDGWMAP